MLKEMKKIIGWFERHYWISGLITLLIAIFIFYMSSKTFPLGPIKPASYLSYVYHFGVYFVFAFFLLISITRGNIKNKYLILIAMLVAIGYGISDELHQFFVPGRACCFEDVLTNSTGIFLAGVFYLMGLNGKKNY